MSPERDDEKDTSPSLLPSDAPFGPPPPKAKRRLFGSKEAASEADDEEPPVVEDVPPSPPPRPRPRPRSAQTDLIPDPAEHELEFVFVAGDAPKAPRAPKAPPAPQAPATAAPVVVRKRPISQGVLIAIVVLLLLVAGVAAYALFFADDDAGVAPTLAPTVAPTAAPTPEPTPAPAALPEECINSFLYAQANTDDENNVIRTTDFCRTVDQWLQAARQYPGALGAASAADVGEDDIRRVCESAPSSAMCRDAEQQGVLVSEATPTASPVDGSV